MSITNDLKISAFRRNPTSHMSGIVGFDRRAIAGRFEDVEIMDIVRARFRLALKEVYEAAGYHVLNEALAKCETEEQARIVYENAYRVYLSYHIARRIPARKEYLARVIDNIYREYGAEAYGPYDKPLAMHAHEYTPPIYAMIF